VGPARVIGCFRDLFSDFFHEMHNHCAIFAANGTYRAIRLCYFCSERNESGNLLFARYVLFGAKISQWLCISSYIISPPRANSLQAFASVHTVGCQGTPMLQRRPCRKDTPSLSDQTPPPDFEDGSGSDQIARYVPSGAQFSFQSSHVPATDPAHL